MLSIAGGTYFERCLEPAWHQLYGSGGRAAAALQHLSSPVQLSTYIAPDQQVALEALAQTFGFDPHATSAPATVGFVYEHPLAVPQLHPLFHQIVQSPVIDVKASSILRFGFIEGDARVTGEYVAYDPQSAFDPQVFATNGSSADHLAIVANWREATLMAAKMAAGADHVPTDVEGVARILLAGGAEVVIVKQGSRGASVVTSSRRTDVPAYKTPRVWPIGSGDVFAAVFASCWADKHLDPVLAAQRAALATAYYCSSRSLPVPSDLSHFTPPVADVTTSLSAQVYLAAPFFTMAQRWIVRQARTALYEQGLGVFSPLHDVGHGSAGDVVPADITALEQSAAVLAIVDGLDSGTLFEIGYARAKGIPVIAFAQDESEARLKMLAGSECDVTDDFSTAIFKVAWSVRGQ
jgi:nucleoside 2-deoxyribosyltransferase